MALNVHTTTNTTSTSTNETYLNKEYYDKRLLEFAKTRFKHAQFGQKRTIPKNNGKTVEYRKWEIFTPSTTALTEGVVPDGQAMKQSHVEATVAQYGAYVTVSDMLEMTAYDPILRDAVKLLGEQMGTTLDWITRDAMCAGTNVMYAGGKTARTGLTAADVLSTTVIRKAVRTLKKAKAPMFSRGGKEHYVCICSPDATYDLQSDSLWQDVSKYQNAEQIYSGEIGRIFGVVFVESTEAKVFLGGGDTNSTTSKKADVHCSLIFGENAYGCIEIGSGGAVESIIKERGSGGTSDPLNQFSTVGAKINAYCAKILQPLWLLRIEHGVTDGETTAS